MKGNKLVTLTLAAFALLWGGCSSELDTSGHPDRAGADEVIVAVSLQLPGALQSLGYADVPEGVALDAEKEIRSIAFIAFTTGGTGVYLSTQPTFAETGFTHPLTPVEGQPAGSYTASFKIRSDNFTGKTTLVAVANFDEHRLSFDAATLSIESLKAMLTQALEADQSIQYPLLMTVGQELDIVEGATVPVAFQMERIMARVDVVNSAYDKQTPANGFVLTSARLLSAAAQGTMIGGQEIAAPTYVNTAVHDQVSEVAPPEGDLRTPVKQQLNPMYAYENTNTEQDDDTQLASTATSVELKGLYKGKEYHKIIPFVTPRKVVHGVLQGGDIVSLARNTRYVVEIASSKEEELTFGLQVTDWVDGVQLDVALDFTAPVLEGLEGFNPPIGALWDPLTRTLDVTHALAGSTIYLVARGNQDSDVAVQTVYDANDTPFAQHITVERGKIEGYAAAEEVGSLSRTYHMTVPDVFPDYPSLTKIIVYNTSYADAQAVITVKYAPFFVGEWASSQPAATIDPATGLIDLKNVPQGTTGSVSFFASSGSELTTTLVNQGLTDNFYTMTVAEVTEADPATYPKYGPGKRVTLAYGKLSENPEFAVVSINDAKGESKKIRSTNYKQPFYKVQLPATANTLVEGTEKVYLAVNNGSHGSIAYTLYENEGSQSTLTPTATYSTTSTSPTWANNAPTVQTQTLPDFQVVKRTVTVALPNVIKNPAMVTAYTIGYPGEKPLQLIPVYPSGTGIAEADKKFRPVLMKGIWWSPISVGQTKISTSGDPSSAAGHLFQWGRKQALNWSSPDKGGPVASAAEAGLNIIWNSGSSGDWLNPANDKLWNSGTETAPVKTGNDPCPAGWRVPTQTELLSLKGTYAVATSLGTINANHCFSISGDEAGTKFYIPAVGCRVAANAYPYGTGTVGYLWTSTVTGAKAHNFCLETKSPTMVEPKIDNRAIGTPVRCVQE